MSATRLLLVRHAESVWNAAGLWQGQADPPLSDAGRRQAAALAARLRGAEFDVLVTSDLLRAAETAEILGAALGLVPEREPRLRERDVGSWSGRTREQIARSDGEGLARVRAGDPDARPGGGETLHELRARVAEALAALRARFAGGRVALVTHRGVSTVIAPGSALSNAQACWAAAALPDEIATARPAGRL